MKSRLLEGRSGLSFLLLGANVVQFCWLGEVAHAWALLHQQLKDPCDPFTCAHHCHVVSIPRLQHRGVQWLLRVIVAAEVLCQRQQINSVKDSRLGAPLGYPLSAQQDAWFVPQVPNDAPCVMPVAVEGKPRAFWPTVPCCLQL